MKKIIGNTVAVLLVLVVVVLAYAASRPDSFRIRRTAQIKAPPEKIFSLINDFHRWQLWSPYEKLDPAMQKTFGGAARGVTATYEWQGNSKAGRGRMEVVDLTPFSRILIKLDFFEPFESHNHLEFSLSSAGGPTTITWEMSGSNSLPAKVMGIFVDMDSMIGADFETGLSNLKSVAER